VILGGSGLSVNPNPDTTTTTFQGDISGTSGAARFIKSGPGTLVLTGNNTYIGGTTVNSGVLIGTTHSLQGDIFMLSGSADSLVFSQNFDGTYAGVLSGSGGFTSNVTATLTVTGVNNYSAGTKLNAGTLAVTTNSALGTGTLTFGTVDGNTLKAGAAGLVLSNAVSLAKNGVINTNSQTFTLSGAISSTGSLTKISTGNLSLPNSNSYSGGTNLQQGTLSVGNSGSLGSGSLTFSTNNGNILQSGAAALSLSNPITLTTNGTIDSNSNTFTLSGTISSTGSLTKISAGKLNLTNSNGYSGGTIFQQGTLSVGANTALGTGTLTFNTNNGNILQSGAAALSLSNPITLTTNGTIDSNGNTFTLSGAISSTGALTKIGTGILTLSSNSSNYSGGTTLSAGTIAVGASNALGTGTFIFGTSGTTLQAASSTLTLGNAIQITGAGNVDTNGNALTLSNTISDFSAASTLTKIGAGTLTLSGTNSYSGGTNLNLGTLAVGSSGALGTAALTFGNQNGNILQAGVAGLTVSNPVSLDHNGTVDTNSNNLTLSGAISSTGALTKIGAGTLTLSVANGYGGGTNLNVGTIAIGNSTALGSGALTFGNQNGNILQTGAAGLSVSNAIVLTNNGTVDTNSNNLTLSGAISNTGVLNKIGAGVLTLSSASSNYSGGTTLNGDTIAVGANSALGSGTFTFATSGTTLQAAAASLSLANTIQITGNGNVDTNGNALTLSNTVSDFSGASTLTKIGSGTLTLSGGNSYSGGTNLNLGTLSVGSNSALGTNALTFGGVDGNILQAASNVALSNAVTLTKNGTIDTNGHNLSLSGTVSGVGFALTKIGTGTLTLSASNSYSAGTNLNVGTLAIGNSNALGTGALTFTANNNILQAVSTLTLSNLVHLANDGVVDTNNQTLTLAGNISGPGGLNKIGQGQLILSGAHDFIGPTTVSAGMLTVDGSLQSSVTVLPSSILNGSGSIIGHTVIGGTLGPGDMIGTIEISGNVTFQPGSTFQVQADPTRADELIVGASGNIMIQPGSTLEIAPVPATYGQQTIYHIASTAEGGGVVVGTFDTVVNTFPLIATQVIYHTAAPLTDSLQAEATLAINQISLILNFAPISSVITKGNPGAIAKSLDGVNPPVGSDLYLVLQQLYFLPTTEALKEALNQMQPSIVNSTSLAQQNSGLSVASAFTRHASDLRLTRAPCVKAIDKKWHIWGEGGVDGASQRGNHQNVGFHATTALGTGGVDYRISQQFYLGVMGAYTGTDIKSHGYLAKGRANTYYGGVYSCWLSPGLFANASLIGDWSDYHTKRKVQFGSIDRKPRGHHRGSGGIAHLDFGLSLPKARRAQYYPYGQLDYLYQHEKGYTETSAQSLNNKIGARTSTMLRSEVGVQGRLCYAIGKEMESLIPSAKLAWVRETRFKGKKIDARLVDVPNSYTVVGLYPDRSMLRVGASLTMVFGEAVHLSLNYDGLFSHKYKFNAGSGAMEVQF